MTEKRFEMVIVDVQGNFYYLDRVTDEKISSTLALESKLNELADENEQLKQQLRIFEDGLKSEIRETKTAMEDWNECLDDCRKLKEENEQLKQFINMIANDCGRIVLMNGYVYNVRKIFGDVE